MDTTEQLHFHFSLSCIGEGNGNPFQCSRLENPRDGGAWWGNTGVGCNFLLQGIFPDPGIEPTPPALAGGSFITEPPGKPNHRVGRAEPKDFRDPLAITFICHLLSSAVKQSSYSFCVRVCAQSCLTLFDLMDCSLPGSSVHGLFQVRVLEWVAISYPRGPSQPRY